MIQYYSPNSSQFFTPFLSLLPINTHTHTHTSNPHLTNRSQQIIFSLTPLQFSLSKKNMQVENQPSGIRMGLTGTTTTRPTTDQAQSIYDRVRLLASGNAVVVFTVSGCCMCHVVKQLLFSLGVGPTVVELDRDSAGHEIHSFLYKIAGDGQQQPVPAVFIGGKFLGGVETLMACHINGTLVPLLKDAGALWL